MGPGLEEAGVVEVDCDSSNYGKNAVKVEATSRGDFFGFVFSLICWR